MWLFWFLGLVGAILLSYGVYDYDGARWHDHAAVWWAWLTLLVVFIRRVFHPHWFAFRWITNGWTIALLLLVFAAGVLYLLFHLAAERAHFVGRTLVGIALVLALAVPFTGAWGWHLKTTSNKAGPSQVTTQSVGSTTTTEPKNTNKVPQIPGWELHYYQFDPGVPTNYFGPACVPNGDANKCKSDLETRMKHDPVLLSAIMLRLHLLPSYFLEEHQNNISSLTDPNQLELYRHQAARELVNVKLRMKWQPRVAAVLDSIPDFHIEALSGSFYTEYVTSSGQVVQTTKQMNPQINFAITGTMPSGEKLMIKIDCGHQPVSPRPLPGVPVIPSKTPPSVTPPPTTTPTTVPGEQGKNHRKSVMNNPNVAPFKKGCRNDSCSSQTSELALSWSDVTTNTGSDGFPKGSSPNAGSSGGTVTGGTTSSGGAVTPGNAGSTDGSGNFTPAPAPAPAPTVNGGSGSGLITTSPSAPSSN